MADEKKVLSWCRRALAWLLSEPEEVSALPSDSTWPCDECGKKKATVLVGRHALCGGCANGR